MFLIDYTFFFVVEALVSTRIYKFINIFLNVFIFPFDFEFQFQFHSDS